MRPTGGSSHGEWVKISSRMTIIKDKIEELMSSEDRQNRYKYDLLKTNVENTLMDLENDTDLFINLLYSMRKIVDALRATGEGHTSF